MDDPSQSIERIWEMFHIVALIDAREEAPKRPQTYRKRRC